MKIKWFSSDIPHLHQYKKVKIGRQNHISLFWEDLKKVTTSGCS